MMAFHPYPPLDESPQRWLESQWPLGLKDSYLQGPPLVTLLRLAPIPDPSKEDPSVLLNCPFLHRSFRWSRPSTRVDQPTIMLRSVSHPSAKTRITCGTTKKMKSHMSQKCHTRAASKPPNSAASQWSCMGL